MSNVGIVNITRGKRVVVLTLLEQDSHGHNYGVLTAGGCRELARQLILEANRIDEEVKRAAPAPRARPPERKRPGA